MQLALTAEPQTVAVVYDHEGNEVDRCYTWEAGQNYANMGYVVQAVNPDISPFTGEPKLTIAEAQDLYDYELRCALDCFGEGYAK